MGISEEPFDLQAGLTAGIDEQDLAGNVDGLNLKGSDGGRGSTGTFVCGKVGSGESEEGCVDVGSSLTSTSSW